MASHEQPIIGKLTRVAALAAALSLSLLTLASCGGDDSESSGGGGTGGAAGSGGTGAVSTGGAAGGGGAAGTAGATADQIAACAANAKSICARHQECYKLMTDSLGTHCEARYERGCLETMFPPGSTMTVALVAACTASHAALTCEQWLEYWTGRMPTLPACVPPPGERAEGASCSRDAQCQTQYCRVDSGAACGTCQKRASENGECQKNLDCVSGLNCANAKCVPIRKEGESCDFVASRCIYGTLYCDTQSGKCAKTKTNAGDACVFTDECAFFDKQLICNGTTQKCEAVGYSDLGGACGWDSSGTISFCKDENACEVDVPDPSKWTGSCVAVKKLGDSCDPSFISGPNGGPCQAPYVCRDGTCQSSVTACM